MSQTHFLPPQKLKICQKDGAYFLKMDGQTLKISPPKRALPLSNPDEWIVLSDEEGEEIGVIRHLDALEPASREVLAACLEEIYHLTPILKILDVEREPLSGQVRWRVETEVLGDEESERAAPEKTAAVRLLTSAKSEAKREAKRLEEESRHELIFFIAGAEDVQTARYPQIFLTDVDGKRYEIANCEALDLNSRRISQQYF